MRRVGCAAPSFSKIPRLAARVNPCACCCAIMRYLYITNPCTESDGPAPLLLSDATSLFFSTSGHICRSRVSSHFQSFPQSLSTHFPCAFPILPPVGTFRFSTSGVSPFSISPCASTTAPRFCPGGATDLASPSRRPRFTVVRRFLAVLVDGVSGGRPVKRREAREIEPRMSHWRRFASTKRMMDATVHKCEISMAAALCICHHRSSRGLWSLNCGLWTWWKRTHCRRLLL